MKRKILSLILVFAMTVSLLTVGTGAVEPTYGDTAGHWAESSIERWSEHGIIQGSNGQFDPNGQLTCAQLATILAKLLKLPAAKDAGFTDNTADAWYYDAINRCAAAGILNGNGDGTVTPEAPITRERAMVMLARALGIEPIRKPDLTKYTDAAQVSAYAQGYVAALIEAGIVGGVTANELAPQDNINRASTVTILDRAISTYADKAGATVKADGKGLVLVVAENVKITNAPEGTKIVVADGATGLTVNGKSVSDDQTYIVPKTEPAKPSSSSSGGSSSGSSHRHSYATAWSYDDTYHWHAATCGHNLKIDEAAHTFTYADNGNGTHTKSCSACSYSATEAHSYGESNRCVCGLVKPNEGVVASVKAADGICTYYSTLPEAVAAAADGATVTLVKGAETNSLKAGITYDLNGYKLTYTSSGSFSFSNQTTSFIGGAKGGTLDFPNISSTNSAIWANAGATLNVSDITVTCNGSAFYPAGNATALNITNCNVSSSVYCVGTNASSTDNYGVIITLKDSKFTSTASNGDSTAVIVNVACKLVIDNCELTAGRQGLIVRAGTATVTNSTIKTTGTYEVREKYYEALWSSGNEVPAAALTVGNYAVGAANAYLADAIVTLENTKLIGENNFPALYVDGNTSHIGKVSISGDAASVSGTMMKGQQTAEGKVIISITGGTFSSNPSAYVAEGYIARTNNDGKYVVSMVGTAENPYTLNEFNTLTKLPAGRAKLYVDIGDVSLAGNSVTIGNKDIADVYTSVTGDYTVGQKLDDGRVVTSVWNESQKIYLANTNKPGTTLYIRGSVKDNNDYGLNNTGNGPFPNSLNFVIPDASKVVFTKDFTVNGYFRCGFSWNDTTNLGGGVASHKIQSVLFDHSTFNGIWIQNGGFEANSLTLDGCTFNAYENKKFANDSNPLWFCNTGSCDITVMNCNFTASRPIKLAEQSAYGTKLTIVNNTFDMSAANTANEDNKPKNDAIMLCKIGNGTLGNVVISGNTVENGTALMAFYNSAGFTMAEGANFTVSGNTLGTGVKTSVEWKTTTKYMPDFVTVTGTPL